MGGNPSFVVVVEFRIDAARADHFAHAVVANARASLERESGCRVFDVCRDPQDAARFLLYEIYDDEAAFQAHLGSQHFKSFDSEVRSWVSSKTVAAWQRIGG